MEMKTIIIIALILLIPISGIGGYFGGYNIGKKQIEKNYQDKISKVFPQIGEIKTISGKIKSISADIIKISALKPAKNILEDKQEMVEYVFSINNQTKFFDRKMKSPEEMSQNMAQNKDGQPIIAPPYTDKIISWQDLKVDMDIQIMAKDNLMLKNKSIAEEIIYAESIIR